MVTVIGICGSLSPKALVRIQEARLIIGSKRLLEAITAPEGAKLGEIPKEANKRANKQAKGTKLTKGTRLKSWSKNPATDLKDLPAKTVILASGDPLWYGIGKKVAELYPTQIIPAVSSATVAAARLRWSDYQTLSLHGNSSHRSIENLNRYLVDKTKIVILTDGVKNPYAIARFLCRRGYGKSKIHILENLETPQEKLTSTGANNIKANNFSPLNVVAVEIAGKGFTPTFGIEATCYKHLKGQVSKPVVRSYALANLMPMPNHLLWDIGSGSGAIAIEWLRLATGAKAVAIEQNKGAAKLIGENAKAMGVPYLEVINQKANPTLVKKLARQSPSPDAVFVGGGLETPQLFELARSYLAANGRLVAVAVTLESQQLLWQQWQQNGGNLVRIQTETPKPITSHRHLWQAKIPAVCYSWVKK